MFLFKYCSHSFLGCDDMITNMDYKDKTDRILALLKKRSTLPPTVSPASVDTRLASVDPLPWGTPFSTFDWNHLSKASKLCRILYAAFDFDDFVHLCDGVQCFENDDLFLYVLYSVVIHRPDCRGVILPSIEECAPHWFFAAETIHEAIQLSIHRPDEDHVVVNQRTAESTEIESRLAYFREDVGMNTHHWAWHVVFPVNWDENETGIIKDRKGELFYYMHQQMMARYDCERLSNDMNFVEALQNFEDKLVGYSPHLTSEITGVHFGSRPEGLKMRDLPNISVRELELWRTRILDAIDQRVVRDESGREISLNNQTGIDILGALVEASFSSVNRRFYGNLHNMGHNVIANVHDPDGRFREYPGPMFFSETAARDPIFYRWHKFIEDIFRRHKRTLTPYTRDELSLQGIRMLSAEVKAKERNIIETSMREVQTDLSHAPFLRTTRKIWVKHERLDHEPFSYEFHIENSTESTRDVTVRVFIGPKFNDVGNQFDLSQQRFLMIELDKFHRKLTPGLNIVSRHSSESSVTLLRRTNVFTMLSDGSIEPTVDYCSCGWPDYMLVPRGSEGGSEYDLFVMCTDYFEDTPEDAFERNVCNGAISYCGSKNRRYPDTKPMGFPFDRPLAVDNFLTDNMILSGVKITFTGPCCCESEDCGETRDRKPAGLLRGKRGLEHSPLGVALRVSGQLGRKRNWHNKGQEGRAVLLHAPADDGQDMDYKDKTDRILALLKKRSTLPPTVSPASVDTRLASVDPLPWGTPFSTFDWNHLSKASKLRRILYAAFDFDDFVHLADGVQSFENDDLFLYVLYSVVIHRPDCRGVILPSIEECAPHWFFAAETLHEAIQLSIHRPDEDHVVVNQRTAESTEIESRLAYFREDVGMNTHHWAWHVVFPVDWDENETGIIKDRKGELFYYMHQQMMARYDCERLSNDMNFVEALQDFQEKLVGYSPHLTSEITGVHFGSRPEGLKMRDRPNISVQELELWRTRILDAIDQRVVRDESGREISLNNQTGIDILGALVEASFSSVNRPFYGNLHNMGHRVIAAVHDPDGRFREYPGVMAFIEAAARDPIFYRWHKFLEEIFRRHKRTLTPYTTDELSLQGIRMLSAEVKAKERNIIETFIREVQTDLSHAPFLRTTRKIWVKHERLDHEPFSYEFHIENSTESTRDVTVRVFIGPKFNEVGNQFDLNQQRFLMIELDKFHRKLTPGLNVVSRHASESSVTLLRRTNVFTMLSDGSIEPTVDYCSCGWPDYMLVPRGSERGSEYDLFVMCTDYFEDTPEDAFERNVCNGAISYCGSKNRRYPDTKPMGFPFDRPLAVDDFLTDNMILSGVKITFTGLVPYFKE